MNGGNDTPSTSETSLSRELSLEQELEETTLALRLTQERHTAILDAVPDLIYELALDGTIRYANQTAAEIAGYSLDRMGELNLADLIGEDDLNVAIGVMRDLLEHGGVARGIKSTVRKADGSMILIEANLVLLKHEDGEPTVLGIARDVTERVRAEAALRASEARYRRLVQNAPIGIVSIDRNGRILEANAKLLEILGSPSPQRSVLFNVLTSPLMVKSGIAADVRLCLQSGEAASHERMFTALHGEKLRIRYHLNAMRDDHGEIVGVQAILEDVPEPDAN